MDVLLFTFCLSSPDEGPLSQSTMFHSPCFTLELTTCMCSPGLFCDSRGKTSQCSFEVLQHCRGLTSKTNRVLDLKCKKAQVLQMTALNKLSKSAFKAARASFEISQAAMCSQVDKSQRGGIVIMPC